MAEKKQPAVKKTCDMTKLTVSGAGLWKYAHQGISEDAVKNRGFFAEALERYGMREGDIVFVNAGNGSAFIIGV